MKEDGNNLPNVSIEEYNKIKEYFMNPEIKNTNNVEMKKCDIKKLEQLLVQRYGLVKLKIINKLNFLDNFFVTI